MITKVQNNNNNNNSLDLIESLLSLLLCPLDRSLPLRSHSPRLTEIKDQIGIKIKDHLAAPLMIGCFFARGQIRGHTGRVHAYSLTTFPTFS